MLKNYLFFLIAILLSWSLSAQCPNSNNVILLSQSEVDAFMDIYPNCTAINGNLIIGLPTTETDITDLSGLSAITSVGGYLRIRNNPSLTNLDGLSALTSVGGYLRIRDNPALTNLDGLSALTSVGGYLRIRDNPALTNVDGLGTLTSVGGNLRIQGNAALTNLNGLNALTSINGLFNINNNLVLTNISGLGNIDPNSITELFIQSNPQLSNCAIESVCDYLSIESNLATISNNAMGCDSRAEVEEECYSCPFGTITLLTQAEVDAFAITYPNCTQFTGTLKIGNGLATTDISDLGGLSNLQTISGNLILFYNDNLSSLEGLDALTKVGGNLYIYRNNALSDLTGLNALTNVGGTFSIFRNDGLMNTTGLNSLSQVGNNLIIRANAALINLDGMESLNEINGFLAVRYNTSLIDIQGLENINPNSIEGVYITNNPLLSNCAIENICVYLAESENIVQIAHNADMCNTVVQVENACDAPFNFAATNREVVVSNHTAFAPSASEHNKVTTAQIKLYPNPTNGQLYLRNVEAQRVVIFSSQGQHVAQYEKPGSELDLSALPPGVYYVNILSELESYTARVVKVD
jgi:hypothetical protein